MTNYFAACVTGAALMLSASLCSQETTLARLGHSNPSEIVPPSVSTTWSSAPTKRAPHSSNVPASALAAAAAKALFVHSDLNRARSLSSQVLRTDPKDAEALFVRMEVAAIEDDGPALLDAAVRLCETGASSDARVQLAGARLRESAANTVEFRGVIPRIKAVLANSLEPFRDLHLALLKASMDGAPGPDPYVISRDAGILTDWRIVGPMGARPLLSNDDIISHSDDLSKISYDNRIVEDFRFPDGRLSLPDYFSRRGTFLGAAHFASLTAARWRVEVETSGTFELYVDGRRLLQSTNDGGRSSNEFEASPGPHRVMVRFAGSAVPLRVTVTPAQDEDPHQERSNLSFQELTYWLAAGHYVSGDYPAAAKQIEAFSSADGSVALQFLLAQSQSRSSMHGVAGTWHRLKGLAPNALSADVALAQIALAGNDFPTAWRLAEHVSALRPTDSEALEIATAASAASNDTAVTAEANLFDLWAHRVAIHPSCGTLRGAMNFYLAAGQPAKAAPAQQQLEGCAPESLAYAKSLSGQGRHAAAAKALRKILAAAPLNRSARFMLVRELQLAGDDQPAQQAAAEWLHIAPNAERYHRLAASRNLVEEPRAPTNAPDFYVPYRRDARAIASEVLPEIGGPSVLLLNDHVAISREDGSVSLYVHTAFRLHAPEEAEHRRGMEVPSGAQVLTSRVIHADGTVTPIDAVTAHGTGSALVPGDTIDEEYVLYYAGDGGISEHSEAFQFVFGCFDQQVLHARFIVLTPAERADRGAVIATGGAPAMVATVRGTMLERVWQENSEVSSITASQPRAGLPIVRVVEEENGWSTPSNAEHQRRIETIHPGPRPQDS